MASLSPSLQRMFHEFDVHWPNRRRGIDGWLRWPKDGVSVGHNPGARNLVHAIDVDRRGIDPDWVIANIYKHTDVLWYIIWNRGIWSNTWGFTRRAYTKSNPHTDHMHIEIRQTVKAEQYNGGWNISSRTGGDILGGIVPGGGGGDGVQGIGAADDRDARDAMISMGVGMNGAANFLQGAKDYTWQTVFLY